MSLFSRYIIKLILLIDLLLVVGLMAEQKLTGPDAFIYTAAGRISGWAKDEHAQLHTPDTPVQMEKILLPRRTRLYPTVCYTVWDDELPPGQAALPLPRLQELATILHCLATKAGVRAVAVSTPLVWEDRQDRMTQLMVSRSIQELSHTAIGLPARTAAQAEATPALLHGAAIPAANIQGSISTLPSANKPLPYHLPTADNAAPLWAPDYVEDETLTHGSSAAGLSLPLLTRWNGEVLPTLPLRLALAQLGLSPADVQVRMGKSLLLGKRILPIDAHGRTPLGAARVQPLPLHELLTARTGGSQPAPACAVIARAYSPSRDNHRAEQLAATLSQLLSSEIDSYLPTERPDGGKLMELNPLQATYAGRIALAALIICALIWLPLLSPRKRQAALGALLIGIISLAIIWGTQGIWMSLCAWLACWALLLPSSNWLARSLKA